MSDVRSGKVFRPNDGQQPDMSALYRLAQQQAEAAVGPDERVFDLQIGTGRPEKGNDAVMVHSYTYQVVGPGGSAAARTS